MRGGQRNRTLVQLAVQGGQNDKTTRGIIVDLLDAPSPCVFARAARCAPAQPLQAHIRRINLDDADVLGRATASSRADGGPMSDTESFLVF